MRTRLLALLVLVMWPLAASAQVEPTQVQVDRAELRQAGLAETAAVLEAELRSRIPGPALLARIEQGLRELGHARHAIREQASRELRTHGLLARSGLRQAAQSSDAEVVRRALACLDHLDRHACPERTGAILRRLTQLDPPRAVDVLLDYAPYAENDAIAGQVRQCLQAACQAVSGLPPALHTALTGPPSARRQLAAEIAAVKARRSDVQPLLRACLRDADAVGRARLGRAMLAAGDRSVVADLLDVLPRLDIAEAWLVEDALRAVAGDRVADTGEAATRDDRLRSWQEALRQEAFEPRSRQAITAVVVRGALTSGRDKVLLLDTQGKPISEWSAGSSVTDLAFASGESLVLLEAKARQLVERTPDGRVVARRAIPGGLALQLLEDGHCLIVDRQELREHDRIGRVTWRMPREGAPITGASRTDDGLYLVAQTNGNGCRMTRSGHVRGEPFSLALQVPAAAIGRSPGGGWLVPEPMANQIIAYDAMGKPVGQIQVAQPGSVVRLRTGNWLIASPARGKVLEVDAQGRTVWEVTIEGTPVLARRWEP